MQSAPAGAVSRATSSASAAILLFFLVFAGSTAEAQGVGARSAAHLLGTPSQARTAAMSDHVRAMVARQGYPERAAALSDPNDASTFVHREPFPLSLEITASTALPLSVGGDVAIGFWNYVFLRMHVGVMVQPYVDMINGALTGFGAYDGSTALVVSRTASNALVLRPTLAVRPVPGYGFEIAGGYTFIDGHADLGKEDFESVTGQSMDYPGLRSVGVRARIHALHAQLGWSWLVLEHLVIRAQIGWVQTLAAEGGVDLPTELRTRAGGLIEEFESTLRTSLTKYGFTPELNLAVGYRF